MGKLYVFNVVSGSSRASRALVDRSITDGLGVAVLGGAFGENVCF